MRRLDVMVGIILVMVGLAHAVPASAPSTQQAKLEALAGGALRFETPPQEWAVYGERSDGNVRYMLGHEEGFIEIAISTVDGVLTEAARQKYGVELGKVIREQCKQEESELVFGPRVEKDERFWLKMHDRRKLKTGEAVDRIQAFRSFGAYIARVAATGVTADQAKAEEIHKVGEGILDRMKVGRGVKPTYYPRTQVKIVPPVDWKEAKSDLANGLTATYTDERKASSKIIVRSRVLPKDARTPGEKQEALLAKMIDDERQTAPFAKASVSQQETPETDAKALKRIKAAASVDGKPVAVDTRYVIVGDVIVSVRAVSEEADAATVSEVAGKLAQAVTPIKDDAKK